jgi:hypothetical protein
MTAHGAMLQRPAIDDNLTRLISRSLKCGGQRHLITRPGHIEVGYVLDAERDPDEHIGTLQSDPVDGVMHGLDEEVSLASGVRRLSVAHGQGVWKCQRSPQSTVVTVTTMTGHLSTVTVFDCSARQARCCLMARSARCDVRWGSRRLRRIRRNDCAEESALVSTRFVGFLCKSAARASRARIALSSRRLRRPQHIGAPSGHGSRIWGALPTIEPARGVASGR